MIFLKNDSKQMILFAFESGRMINVTLQFLLVHLSSLVKWGLSEIENQAHSKFNVTCFISILSSVLRDEILNVQSTCRFSLLIIKRL